MKILGIECTATSVSCAIYSDGKILGEYFLNLKVTHSQTLLPMVESMLKLTNEKIDNLDAIAVTSGPGSFTGVRIGISAVKGLATPDNIPCIPVSVLESMAYNLLGKDVIVCAVMDARCNQVYNANFDISNNQITRLCDDRALIIDELYDDILNISKKYPEKSIFIVGDGANLVYNRLKDKDVQLELAPEHLRYQRASSVCLCAENSGERLNAKDLLPFYLRLPQAERELKAKQGLK